MRVVAALLVVLLACNHGAKGPFITGITVYTHAAELRRDGSATVTATDQTDVQLRRTHFLITKDRDQVFVVEQVVENCKGGDAAAEVDCTIALLLDKQFTVQDEPPTHAGPKPEWKHAGKLKALIWTSIIGGGLTAGAFRCHEDCRDLLAIGAVLSGVVWVLIVLSFFTDFHD